MNRQAWGPGELLETSGGYLKSCTLHAAVKLDLFSRLGDASLQTEEIADLVHGSVRGVGMLLDALSAMGLLVKAGGRYSASEAARTWLAKGSDSCLGHILLHHHHLVDSWGRLDEAVLSGRPVGRPSVSSETWRESFLMGMFNMAMAAAPRVVTALDLSPRRRLLDLGGGPGTYAIHFCQANPRLRASVFDLPATRPFAERTIDRFQMRERVEFVPGDYHTDPIPGRFDVAWLSHILHAEGPEESLGIIRKAVSALEPGGMVAIHECLLDETGDGPLFPALFALNMLLGTPAGQAYSGRELSAMLREAGAIRCRRLPLEMPNDSGIVVGEF